MTFFTLCNARTAFAGVVADTISSESQWTRGKMRGRSRGNMLAGTDYVQAGGTMMVREMVYWMPVRGRRQYGVGRVWGISVQDRVRVVWYPRTRL